MKTKFVMKQKFIKMYLDMAQRISEESHALRLKVGAVFVSPDGVMSTGINGLPAGGGNECEERIFLRLELGQVPTVLDLEQYPFVLDNGMRYYLKTKEYVSHAEENLFGKLMRQGVSTKGGTIFLTHEPCINCAKIMVVAGIKEVYFTTSYSGSNKPGTEWLAFNNVKVRKFVENQD